MNECNHGYGSCSANCENRTVDESEFLETLNPASSVGKMVGIASGRRGIEKSLVISMMAVSVNRRGKKTAVLGAGITRPLISIALSLPNDGVMTSSDNKLMLPARSTEGVETMSASPFLDKDTGSVV